MNHFEMTDNTMMFEGVTLTQIRGTTGDLGGWIEHPSCIQDTGWVCPDAKVLYGGEIRGGVMYGGVMHGGEMHGGEMYGGVMWGGVMRGGVMHGGVMWGGVIRGGEILGGEILGGVMYGGEIRGGVMRGGEILGGVMRGGVMRGGVMHDGVIRGGVMRGGVIRGGEFTDSNNISFANVGSENGYLLARKSGDDIIISRGCFYGTIDEFYAKVEETHGDNEHGLFYKSLRPIIEAKLK